MTVKSLSLFGLAIRIWKRMWNFKIILFLDDQWPEEILTCV